MGTGTDTQTPRVGRRICPICNVPTEDELCGKHGTKTLLLDVVASNELPPLGALIGNRYFIERLIGRGGAGAVFAARHTGTGQEVAIKTLTRGIAGDDVALRRFFQEARVTSGLRHPNTIRVFDFGQDETGIVYIAMELLTGTTLRRELNDRQRENRVFTEREACDIGIQVTRSLAEAHAAGLVHRDLKLENIFLHKVAGDDPQIKVLDFGIVKSVDSTLTQGRVGPSPGTPSYMSPEQVTRHSVDQRSDLYSLGIVLYTLVTGAPPFRGEDAIQTLYMHVHQPVPDIHARARTPISLEFAAVIHRALEKDPERRPSDALEMRALLEACLVGERDLVSAGKKSLREIDPPPRAPPPGTGKTTNLRTPNEMPLSAPIERNVPDSELAPTQPSTFGGEATASKPPTSEDERSDVLRRRSGSIGSAAIRTGGAAAIGIAIACGTFVLLWQLGPRGSRIPTPTPYHAEPSRPPQESTRKAEDLLERRDPDERPNDHVAASGVSLQRATTSSASESPAFRAEGASSEPALSPPATLDPKRKAPAPDRGAAERTLPKASDTRRLPTIEDAPPENILDVKVR